MRITVHCSCRKVMHFFSSCVCDAWWGCGHDLIHIYDWQTEQQQSLRPEEDRQEEGATQQQHHTQQDADNS